jgi:hypothetical protein
MIRPSYLQHPLRRVENDADIAHLGDAQRVRLVTATQLRLAPRTLPVSDPPSPFWLHAEVCAMQRSDDVLRPLGPLGSSSSQHRRTLELEELVLQKSQSCNFGQFTIPSRTFGKFEISIV